MTRVLIFTMHRTTPFWRYLASKMEFATATCVLSDSRNDGDASVASEFYRHLRSADAAEAADRIFGPEVTRDIVDRCRVLRSLDNALARRMVGAMARALTEAIDRFEPDIGLSFTIDRYVMDILERLLRRRGVPFLEMTTSILPDRVMFLQRGKLLSLRMPEDAEIEAAIGELGAPDFAPIYVRDARRFGWRRYWRIFAYYELRGVYFNILRHLRRDPLNLHYLDALKRLKHKVRWGDYKVLNYLRPDWESRIADIPVAKRVFIGLQLFPEASLDYWLEDPSLRDHDRVIVELADALGAAGYHVLVKDHPLQFGFRQRELIETLAARSHVTLVPYEVPGERLIELCGVCVALTGTLGYQAALAGKRSVVADPYYAVPGVFVRLRQFSEIAGIPAAIGRFSPAADPQEVRRRLVRHLLGGSLPGNYFGFRGFDSRDRGRCERLAPLVRSLNDVLPKLGRRTDLRASM